MNAKLCEHCNCKKPGKCTVCQCRKYAPLAPRIDRTDTLLDEADAKRQAAADRRRV
ncbi:MAG: hypothetical protein AABZ39_05735 [Spirochaetota bacterium]